MRKGRLIIQTCIALVFVFLFSCKTTERVADTRLRPMSTTRLLKNVEDNVFDYSHLAVRRVNLMIDDGESKNTFRAGMQVIRDTEIQISVTKFNIPLGRISLSPDSLLFINYIERNYIADSYRALSSLFDLDLDFNAIQAILSGNVFFFFDDWDDIRDYNSYIDDGMYMIQSEKVRKLRRIKEKGREQRLDRYIGRTDAEALVAQTFYFDPEKFVLRRMYIEDKTNDRLVHIKFDAYTKVSSKYYPGAIDIVINNGGDIYRFEARMSGFSTEVGELTPMRIPERYQRMVLY